MRKNLIHNIKTISLVFWLGFNMVACNDFLDQQPDNRTEIDNVETVAKLLVTAYPNSSHIEMAELMSDNVTDLGPAYTSMQVWNKDIYKWEPVIDLNQDTPAAFWAACYSAIAAANHALEAIDELGSTDELLPYKGEALLCRAYSHFMLVNIFSQHYNANTAESDLGVPYATDPEVTVLADYKRESVAKVYELIENDLTEGLSMLSNTAYTVPKYHFTIQAANVFASRFYLYKGEWEKCIEHANIALGDNPLVYMRDWETYDTYTPNEFLEMYTRSTDNANLLMMGSASWWARAYTRNQYGVTVQKRDYFYGYYSGLHPWGGGQEVGSGTYINTGTYAMKNIYNMGADIWFTPKWDEKFKYSYPGANTGIGYIMQPIFTGEEVLLNRAEALIMAGKTSEGIADLNLWVDSHCPYPGSIPEYLETYYGYRPHADLNPGFNIPEENKLLIQSVLDIRHREFLHDGLRWFDIKRYNFQIEHEIFGGVSLVLPPNDPRRAVQIPQDALNNGIEPNPREPLNYSDNDYITATYDL
ncbi:RagB/SusD family nutrient uptake outer membrane protein [Saccharicrinis aurantiacus]|uniref:RagB/SusD family nutrient uptake outer membrane protein n=1 Tax=Saccharicrinis aurantiacus TaxID=1849719 RepID=UPI0009F81B36|nr:RagB/SusD family nutrient uptake outer membrane protein [Saccharicrinis aurantiacus]